MNEVLKSIWNTITLIFARTVCWLLDIAASVIQTDELNALQRPTSLHTSHELPVFINISRCRASQLHFFSPLPAARTCLSFSTVLKTRFIKVHSDRRASALVFHYGEFHAHWDLEKICCLEHFHPFRHPFIFLHPSHAFTSIRVTPDQSESGLSHKSQKVSRCHIGSFMPNRSQSNTY